MKTSIRRQDTGGSSMSQGSRADSVSSLELKLETMEVNLERRHAPDPVKMDSRSLMSNLGAEDSINTASGETGDGIGPRTRITKRYSQVVPEATLQAVRRQKSFDPRQHTGRMQKALKRRHREIEAAWSDIAKELAVLRDFRGEVDPSRLPLTLRTALNRNEDLLLASREELLRWCNYSDIGMAGDGVKQTLDAAGIVYDEDWFSLESLRSAVDPILNECCMVGAMNETNDADSNVASDEEGEDKFGSISRPAKAASSLGALGSHQAPRGTPGKAVPRAAASVLPRIAESTAVQRSAGPAGTRGGRSTGTTPGQSRVTSAAGPRTVAPSSQRSKSNSSMAPVGLKRYVMGQHQQAAMPERHIKGSKQDYIVVRGNEALNSAVGHKVTKLSVLSESELINLKEIFDRISGESATINQASFMSFLSSISPTMAKEATHLWGTMDRKGNGQCDFPTVISVLYPGATKEEVKHMVHMASKRRRKGFCTRKLWDSMQKVFEQNDKFTSGGVLTMNPIIEGMVALGWSAATVEKILFRISEQRIVKAISFDDFEMWFTRTVSANNMTLAFLRIAQELELFEQDDD